MDETAAPEVASTPTSVTTEAELGVIGAQAARAERAARPKLLPDVSVAAGQAERDEHARLAALTLAHDADTLPENVVARAAAYLAFIKGDTNG